jgi:hypothetical protein
MVRNCLGVLAGFALWSVLWLLGGIVVRLTARGAFDEEGMTGDTAVLGTLIGLSAVCSVSSGWVAGVLARRRPLGVALALGLVLLAVGVAVQTSVWDQMPLWYHLTFFGLIIPASVAGGALVKPS